VKGGLAILLGLIVSAHSVISCAVEFSHLEEGCREADPRSHEFWIILGFEQFLDVSVYFKRVASVFPASIDVAHVIVRTSRSNGIASADLNLKSLPVKFQSIVIRASLHCDVGSSRKQSGDPRGALVLASDW
jgi:hypothetical protein